MSGFRKLDEREVWRGAVVSAGVGRYEAPDGTVFERDVVHHPGAVVVVPVLDGGATVLLVRQYRSPIDAELLELPAGKRDVTGEPPEVTAARELEEEVGMRAGRLQKLGEYFNSPGFCDEHSHLFMGLDLEECATSFQGVEEIHMTIVRVALADVPAMIASGAIVDAKTIIGLLLAREALSGT
ncbi:MAG: NUDIX hydrolase [Acidimicrobiales bacterium]